MDDRKPELLYTAKLDGGCIVKGYDFGKKPERKTDSPKRGEPVFLICPICHDENAPLYPVVQVDARGKTHINHLMCGSESCAGNTIMDIHRGVVLEDVRILEDE